MEMVGFGTLLERYERAKTKEVAFAMKNFVVQKDENL